jgi:hypothetical protein
MSHIKYYLDELWLQRNSLVSSITQNKSVIVEILILTFLHFVCLHYYTLKVAHILAYKMT